MIWTRVDEDERLWALIASHRMLRCENTSLRTECATLGMQALRDKAEISCLKTKLRSLAQKNGKRGKGRRK